MPFQYVWYKRTNMGTDLGRNNCLRDVRSIDKELDKLYSRRSTVENLIRCLESYAECQAKGERRERLKLRSA